MKEHRYIKIFGVNLRHHALLPVLTAVGVFVLTASFFNLSALTAKEAARPIEFFLCFVGVMLLTPIFYPEQDHDLRDVVCARKTSYVTICTLRLFLSMVVLVLLVVLFVGLMKWNESAVTGWHVLGGISTAVFLGAIGLFAAGITDNTTLGYMAAMLYYLASYGMKEKLGKFFLFYMSMGNFKEKVWLFPGAVVLVLAAFLVMAGRRKRLGY